MSKNLQSYLGLLKKKKNFFIGPTAEGEIMHRSDTKCV